MVKGSAVLWGDVLRVTVQTAVCVMGCMGSTDICKFISWTLMQSNPEVSLESKY